MKRLIAALSLAGASIAAAAPSFALTQADVIGERGNPSTAARTLDVAVDTRYLNVESGETVNLHVNGERVTWTFDGLASVVNLQDIARGGPDIDIYVSQPNDD